MGFLKGCYGNSLWYSYGISIGFLWDFYDMSMIFPVDSYDISMRFLWDLKGISTVLLRYFYLKPTESKLKIN